MWYTFLMDKRCQFCKKQFHKRETDSLRYWGERKFCQRNCWREFLKEKSKSRNLSMLSVAKFCSTTQEFCSKSKMKPRSAQVLLRKLGIKLPSIDRPPCPSQDEKKAANWLVSKGFKPIFQPYRRSYDLIVNGKRVEIKSARPRNWKWRVNIHRHNHLDESKVDVYIFSLYNFPGGKSGLHIIVPSPVKRSTMSFTVRSLISKWSRYVNAFEFLESKKMNLGLDK